MSFRLVDQAIELDVGDSTAKLVLIIIARHARDDGTGCVVGQETLADMAECTVRTIYQAIGYLDRVGLIRRRKRFRKDGTRTSDETILAVDTTGRICRWSTDDHRKKTTSTTGRKRHRPPEESSREAVRGISKRNRSEREAPHPAQVNGHRHPNPALSDPDQVEEWTAEARSIRPDLTDQQIGASLTTFKDHYPTGQQTAGKWRNWIRREDPTRTTTRGQRRVGRDRNAAALYGTDHSHEAIEEAIDPATIIDGVSRRVASD